IQVEDLMRLGTSMGGARPKTVVEDAGALWIAKFNRPDDRWNHARVEHAMLVLARECGLNVAQSRVVQVGDRDALLVKRFDRLPHEDGYARARMLSALRCFARRTPSKTAIVGRMCSSRRSSVASAQGPRMMPTSS